MKILVFSDTHLGLPFEEKKYKLLKSAISKVDHVIINGDFWEGYQLDFSQFIGSPWKSLFPILKSKNTVYIYGNHDKKLLSDQRISLFSSFQLAQFKKRLNGNTLIFEHGNRLYPFFDDVLKLKRPPPILSKQTEKFTRFMLKKYKKSFIKFFYKRFNNKLKEKIGREFRENEIVICGHTHAADFDLKNRFINTGFIRHGLAQYLLIEDERLLPQEEWYE